MTGNPNEILHRVFGFTEFRGVQRQVIDRVMAGEPTLAVMPTGAGKLFAIMPALARRAPHWSSRHDRADADHPPPTPRASAPPR